MAEFTTTPTMDEPMTAANADDSESTHPLAEAGQQGVESARHLASRAVEYPTDMGYAGDVPVDRTVVLWDLTATGSDLHDLPVPSRPHYEPAVMS